MNEKLQPVLGGNLAIQRQAKELNLRAGKIIFPVMSRDEWKERLAARLHGARRVGEIADLETIRLPELDQKIVKKILAENPEKITVIGQVFKVEYRSDYAPRIFFEKDAVENNSWNNLPDAGVKLPGGREVEVKIEVSTSGWYGTSYANTNIPALKEEVRNYFNQKAWDDWQKPEITIPDLTVDGAVIPEIIAQEYGKCAVTGSLLLAYGTLVINSSRYYDSDPQFKSCWTRSREEAEKYHEANVEKLAEVKIKEIEKRQLQEAEASCQAAKNKAVSLYNNSDYRKLESCLRDKLLNVCCKTLQSNIEQLNELSIEIKAVCAEVEIAYAEITRCREERRKNILLPDGLLEIFENNEDLAYEFLSKVTALPAARLDKHIIQNCGREKIRRHLEEISGDSNFFMRVDPNDVVRYVSEIHFGKFINNIIEENTSESVGSFGEALQKALANR